MTQRRTIRKFQQKTIPKDDILSCIEAARLSASAANLQPLEYVVVSDNIDDVFDCTKWAGYLKDGAPKSGERPVAYVVIVSNSTISKDAKIDVGLAAGNLINRAWEKGVGSCLIGALDREKLAKVIGLKPGFVIELVVALGYPAQESKAEECSGDVKYWVDDFGVVHVPKRKMSEIVHRERLT